MRILDEKGREIGQAVGQIIFKPSSSKRADLIGCLIVAVVIVAPVIYYMLT